MNSEANKNKIEFLGFSLLDCSFHRDFTSGAPKKLFIIVDEFRIGEKNVCNVGITVKIFFQNESNASFKYHSQFRIHDIKWFNELNLNYQNLGISNLFSLTFPYVRSSISNITNDSLGSISLPVINILEGDITKGVSFLSSTKSIKQ